MASSDVEMEKLRDALSTCSSETVRLIQPLLSLPALQHMLLVFLSDQSRSFEDWIMDPHCRHRLSQLRDRIDSQDVPALTASYQEQVELASQQRLRTSKTLSRSFPPPAVASTTEFPPNSADTPNSPANSHSHMDREIVIKGNGFNGNTQSVEEHGTVRRDIVEHMPSGEASVFADSSVADPSVTPTSSTSAVGGVARSGELDVSEAGLEEDAENSNEDLVLEDACDMLVVIAEALKDDAKSKFQRGDFMGAAKTYRRAAVSLDERVPPTGAKAEPLRQRMRNLYVTCMCNAAVAGFKAAGAAPAPGEAQALVVDVCSQALKRCGGHCPKARFWRARVKICQHMYDAAESDLRKAVEDEERAVEGNQTKNVKGLCAENDRADGATRESGTVGSGKERAVEANNPVANGNASNGAVANGHTTNGTLANGQTRENVATLQSDDTANRTDGSNNNNSSSSSNRNSSNSSVTTTQNTNGPPQQDTYASVVENRSNGVMKADDEVEHQNPQEGPEENPITPQRGTSTSTSTNTPVPLAQSEAARWLARIRAKLAKMHEARALAANQASVREERSAVAREKASQVARIRARHGPGHVPRRSPSRTGQEPRSRGITVEKDRKGFDRGEGRGSGRVGMMKVRPEKGGGGEGEEDVDIVWKVPRPPPLNAVNRTPAVIMNDYSMHARFQALPEYEQVTGENGQAECICSYSVGPNDRLVGSGRGPNMKTAKQRACIELLTNAAVAWNEENPNDLIDMVTMVPPPTPEPKKRFNPAKTEVTEEFMTYVSAWVQKVAADEIQEACFPIDVDKYQRKYVHTFVEERKDPAVLSKSCTVNGRRRLSVMRRAMMEGLAYLSGGKVTVVDIPGPPTLPSDVPDLGPLTRPRPAPAIPAELAKKITVKQPKHSPSESTNAGGVAGDVGESSGSAVVVEESPFREHTDDVVPVREGTGGWGKSDAVSANAVNMGIDSSTGSWGLGREKEVYAKAAPSAVV